MAGSGWHRWDGADLVLQLRVRPNAREHGALGLHGDALRVAIKAVATDDKANAALIAWLAESFGVTRRDIEIEHGRRQRSKRVRIRAPERRPRWYEELGGSPGPIPPRG